MDKTLEELRKETDTYIRNITNLCEEINYRIQVINTKLKESQDILTEEQMIEAVKDGTLEVTESTDSTIL